MAALTWAPVTVAMHSSDSILYYKSGIFSDDSCPNNWDELNHEALVIGYDHNSWIVKNSWGEDGFIRTSRKTSCGLTLEMY